MISIIAPSRGRAVKSIQNANQWFLNSKVPFEFILSLDIDDPEIHKYKSVYGPNVKVIVNNNRSAVDAINNAANVSTGDILIVVSDDTETINGWDEKIIFETQGKTDWIMKTKDGIQNWIITFPIIHRAYYNRFGYIYYPEYRHLFADTELTCVADITGRKITSNLLFPHKHYSVTKEQPDEINKKADATWKQGEKLFLERYARNFDLPKGGRIEGQAMIDWLQLKAK